MLPTHRLLAKAFHRVPPLSQATSTSIPAARRLSTSLRTRKWEGSKAEDHVLNEPDTHNVQHDAHKDGQKERAKGDESRGTSGQAGDSNAKAREEFPEAPE